MSDNDRNILTEKVKILSEEIHRYINLYFRTIVFYLAIVGVSVKLFFDLKGNLYSKVFWVLIQVLNLLAIFCIYSFMSVIRKIDAERQRFGAEAEIAIPTVPSFIFHAATCAVVLGMLAWFFVWRYFVP